MGGRSLHLHSLLGQPMERMAESAHSAFLHSGQGHDPLDDWEEGIFPSPWNFAIFILWLEWTLLAISILTTKQHYMFDLVTGVIVAHLAWLALERAMSNARDLGPSRFTEESGWTD